jgi:hypothetical protein
MTTLLQKYSKYINGKEIINNIYKYVHNKYGYKQFKSNNKNYTQNGGSIKTINEILKQYTDINISIDLTESTDEEIRIIVLTIDDKFVCASFILNYENNICEIIDLRSNSDCIKSNEKFIPKIIEIIKGITKSANIKSIELSDNSYHTCANSTNNFRLDIGNTLTDGYPYYYKYGFKYQNKVDHLNVKTNYFNLKNIKTKDLDLNDIVNMVKLQITHNKLLNIKKIEKYIRFLYEKHNDSNIRKFIKSIKYEMCDIFSMINMSLYVHLNLISYTSKVMVYKIF